jgi:hypothetical protein
LYECETLSLTLREEHRLNVYENRVMCRYHLTHLCGTMLLLTRKLCLRDWSGFQYHNVHAMFRENPSPIQTFKWGDANWHTVTQIYTASMVFSWAYFFLKKRKWVKITQICYYLLSCKYHVYPSNFFLEINLLDHIVNTFHPSTCQLINSILLR